MPARLFGLIKNDEFAMSALNAVRAVGPVGAFIAAGFIRNRYWDSLYPDAESGLDVDIDVVYFDRVSTDKNRDLIYEQALENQMPTGIWQVRNQARMHAFGNHPPFTDLPDALCHWAETATTVGLRLTKSGDFRTIAPFGLNDLYGHILRITPSMKRHDPDGFDQRLATKGWHERWPRLTVIGA